MSVARHSDDCRVARALARRRVPNRSLTRRGCQSSPTCWSGCAACRRSLRPCGTGMRSSRRG
uniref:Uncharacterized protein n=1 Tax=uncultured marine virus TaxID=186617 RepID=A0A0F7L8B6_9VIRU|nr:hypothetical protein [uncultured marine virus]